MEERGTEVTLCDCEQFVEARIASTVTADIQSMADAMQQVSLSTEEFSRAMADLGRGIAISTTAPIEQVRAQVRAVLTAAVDQEQEEALLRRIDQAFKQEQEQRDSSICECGHFEKHHKYGGPCTQRVIENVGREHTWCACTEWRPKGQAKATDDNKGRAILLRD
jgi:hypothetical protein